MVIILYIMAGGACIFALLLLYLVIAFIFFDPEKEEREKRAEYEAGEFYRQTKLPLSKVISDKGIRGEYETYKALESFASEDFRFLFNLYVPDKGDKLAEIDMVAITTRGIIVIEAKNISGTIFGNELEFDWSQNLQRRNGDVLRHELYNPVLQNATHIHSLRNILGDRIKMHSLVVFSDSCDLSNVVMYTNAAQIVRRCRAQKAVENILHGATASLGQKEINEICERLLPYTQVNNEVKERHLKQVRSFK